MKANLTSTTRTRRRDTLQARLIASHALVILIALGLVLSASSVFLRRYETRAEAERLAQLAVPLVAQANAARLVDEPTGASTDRRLGEAALDAQAAAMDVRLIVVNGRGNVRYDSSVTTSLENQELPEFASNAVSVLTSARSNSGIVTQHHRPRGDSLFTGKNVLIAAGTTGPLEPRRALVIVSDRNRVPVLRQFLPRLLLITGIALLFASMIGFGLSRRIAGPIQRLTHAADGIAAGRLDQHVDGTGTDEIARLIGSFNTMSAQVAATHRSQRDLLANVAHELRTPLTSVQGYARALRDDVIDDDESRSRALDVIGVESEKMTTLIAQLLELARLESGQTQLTLTDIEANELLRQVEERFTPAATAKGVQLLRASGSPIRIHADEMKMTQALSNLVANALRHTPAGGRITLSATSSGAGRVALAVSDTGTGIPDDDLPRIFDRFHRGETPQGEAPGFGLGLAIVQEIVERHGGLVSVESHAPGGTTFSIDIPEKPHSSDHPR